MATKGCRQFVGFLSFRPTPTDSAGRAPLGRTAASAACKPGTFYPTVWGVTSRPGARRAEPAYSIFASDSNPTCLSFQPPTALASLAYSTRASAEYFAAPLAACNCSARV